MKTTLALLMVGVVTYSLAETNVVMDTSVVDYFSKRAEAGQQLATLVAIQRIADGAERWSYLGMTCRRILAEYKNTGMTDKLLADFEDAKKLSEQPKLSIAVQSGDPL